MSDTQQLASKTVLVGFNIIDGENEYLETLTMQSDGSDELEQAYRMIADYYGVDDDDKNQIIQNLKSDEMAMIDIRGIDGVYIKDPHTVKIIVSGGVVQSITGIPPEFQIQIYDYDVDGMENPDHDSDGQPCSISIWTTDSNE
jgi:hypothetical protein